MKIRKKAWRRRRFSPIVLACMGLLISLELVCERLLVINVGSTTRFSLTFVPRAISGLCLGSLPAALIGILADLIGAFFWYGSVNPGITLAAGLRGILYGTLFYRKCSVCRAVLAAFVSQFLIGWGLVSLSLCWFGGVPVSSAFFLGRLPQCIAMFAAESLLLGLLSQSFFPQLKKMTKERLRGEGTDGGKREG